MKFQSKILQDHARSISIVFKILPNGARYRRFRPQQAFGVSHEKVGKKGKSSKEEEKRKARGLPLSLPRPNGARYRRFRPQQAFGVSHEKVGGKKGRAAKKKRKGRLVDFHCPCPAPMEPGTGASVHNKRSGWAMKKLAEKREEQQRRREKEGSWTSTAPAPPQWSQVQALPSTTSVRGEPWKKWGKKGKSSKEEEKRKARGLPLSLPRPNGARYRRFRPQQAFGVSHEKVGGKRGRAAKKKRKGRLVDFHCPCPAPMEPGTGASVHNKRSGWAMKKLGGKRGRAAKKKRKGRLVDFHCPCPAPMEPGTGASVHNKRSGWAMKKLAEKGEEQQRRREKEGSWTSTVPAPPQWSQVQALPSTTSVRGEPWKSWGKKGKSSKEEEKRKARGLPLSLPRPNGARYRRFRPQQAFGVSHEKVGGKKGRAAKKKRKGRLVDFHCPCPAPMEPGTGASVHNKRSGWAMKKLEKKGKSSKEEEKRKARGLPLSLPRPNGARYRRFRPQQAFGVSHEKVGGKKGRAAKKKRKGRLVDFHCPCPAPMEPGTGASVHNKRSGWAMKKLGEPMPCAGCKTITDCIMENRVLSNRMGIPGSLIFCPTQYLCKMDISNGKKTNKGTVEWIFQVYQLPKHTQN